VRVSTKLWSGYGLLLLLMGSLLAYHISIIQDLSEAQRRLTAISVQVSVTSTEQLYRFDRLLEAGRKFDVSADSGYVTLYAAIAVELDSAIASLDTLSRGAVEAERVEDLVTRWATFRAAPTGTPSGVPETPVLANEVDAMKQAVIDVAQASRSAMRSELDRAARDLSRAQRSAWIVGGVALLTAFIIILLIIRSISGSLGRLSEATRRVAAGEFGHRLKGSHDEEFRELARNFDAMVRRLDEVDGLKRDFLSGISHDLKSPLASITEAMRVLLDGVPGPVNERQQKLLKLGLASGERLSAMISDLLMLAQLESQAVSYSFEPVDVATVVRQTVDRMVPRFQQAVVAVDLTAPESLFMDCDEARISQVVENLLDNALKFSPRGSTVRVEIDSASENGDREGVYLRVSDEGPGVADADKRVIFDRFTQRGEPGGSAGGVGLGLTICREIVTAHDGSIGVEDRPDGGSTFIVVLPGTQPGGAK